LIDGLDEFEKLMPTSGKERVTLGDVETMVLARKHASLYELPTPSPQDRTKLCWWLDALCPLAKAKKPPSPNLYVAKTSPDAGDSERKSATGCSGRLWQDSRSPFAAEEIIKQPPLQSKRELTRAFVLTAKADLAYRPTVSRRW